MTPDELAEFSPPYGDGTEWGKDKLKAILFSPPYGDGIDDSVVYVTGNKFSPPCGDCTHLLKNWGIIKMFSSPYGDGTLTISQNIAKLKSGNVENMHFITMNRFRAGKSSPKFVRPALCTGRFHGMMQIREERSDALC